MRTVKISTPFPAWPLIQQTPRRSGVWGAYRFVIDQPIDQCDYWIVFDGLLAPETVRCPRKRTLLITAEPPSVKRYKQAFVSQFGAVITTHDYLRHSRILRSHSCLPWHVGRKVKGDVNIAFVKDYDQLKAAQPGNKSKVLSVITSDKAFTEEHRMRLGFVQALKEAFGDQLDVFGRGVRDVEDKWDAIAPYKYHIALENSLVRDYWTEKIADTYLAWSYPFYAGCPNLGDYFPAESFTQISYASLDEAVVRIKRDIEQRKYESALAHIGHARDLCLDVYNFFPTVASWCDRQRRAFRSPGITLLPEGEFLEPPEGENVSTWDRIKQSVVGRRR